jgi:hypothetical protein
MNQAAKVQDAKGPLVWLDMDQKALDDAYDQTVYAPNREQTYEKAIFNSHRVRERLIKSRTALVNEVRGLLAEYGHVIQHTGVPASRRGLLAALEDAENGLTPKMRDILFEMNEEFNDLEIRIKKYEQSKRSINHPLSNKRDTHQNSAFIQSSKGASPCNSPPNNNIGSAISLPHKKANNQCRPTPRTTIFA